MTGSIHHLARDEHGIAHAPKRRNRPRAQTLAVHDLRVHLRIAIEVEARTGPRVEVWIVLQQDDRCDHGIQRGSASREHAQPHARGRTHAGQGRCMPLRFPRARPAVDDDCVTHVPDLPMRLRRWAKHV